VLSDERVLVGTERGPAFVDGDRVSALAPTAKKERSSLSSPMHATWALASGPDGTLYVGTTVGLYYGKGGRFERASLAAGDLSDDWVTALAVEGSDVFVGTYSQGVTRLRFGGTGRPAPSDLGGGHINADGLVVAGGLLYAATMDGLLTRPLGDDAASWASLPAVSPGRDVTAVRFVGGQMWVASRRGIAISARGGR
jgi:ligand-binding sensor domain-containing protein